jgi:hypothetical protein
MKPWNLSCLAMLLNFCLAATTAADPIYSNLGPGLSYSSSSAIRAASGSSVVFSASGLAAATPFDVPIGWDYGLTDIFLALYGPATPVLVELRDNAGGAPGATIASWTMTFPAFSFAGTIAPAQAIAGLTGITLDAGATYWLAILPTDPATDTWWYRNSTGQTNIKADSFDGGATWSNTLNANVAFGVFGTQQAATPVTDPGSLVTLGGGLLGLAGARARRRTSREPRGADVSPAATGVLRRAAPAP